MSHWRYARVMAELDYAYLADYVSIQEGKLTAIGASFTFVGVDSLPSSLDIGIAGRVRVDAGTRAVDMEVRISGPSDSHETTYRGELRPGETHRPYGNGTLGLLFALNAQMVLESSGLYEVNIYLEGEHARRLAFEVEDTAS